LHAVVTLGRVRLRALALGLCFIGCQAAPSPHLVQVNGISSERIAEGDLIELRGSGFPEGRPARVTLRGDLFRPGRAPERGFELVLPARSSSPHTVAAEVTRDVEIALTGPDAGHATFRGSVEAAFFPLSAGMPPVTGGLSAAVIDVVPLGSAPPDARVDEAKRFAEFSGVLFADDTSFVVDGVMPKSPAERAGVVRGDRLSELAGIRLLERGDLVPPPRARRVDLVVHRNGVADPVRLVLETDGFSKMVPADLAAAAGVLAAALALFGILRSPVGRAASFLELRLVELLRLARERRRARALERGARRRDPGFLHAVLPARASAYLALAAGTGLVVYIGIGGAIAAREVDLAVLSVASFVATTMAALLFGAPGERGVAARLKRVGSVLAQALPFAGALASAALASGGVGVDELTRAQGALPWQWHAFHGPVLLAATLVFIASLVPEATRGSGDDALSHAGSKRTLARAVPELVGWAHLVIACGVGSFAFLGGARASVWGQLSDAPLGTAFLSAAVVVIKALLLVLVVLVARAVIGRPDVRETKGLTFRVLVPVAAFSLLATFLSQRADVRPIAGAVAATLGVTCFLGVLVFSASFARRVFAGTLGRDAEPGVNPWI
jgi:NADH-quinone oxidoreductase subunit H